MPKAEPEWSAEQVRFVEDARRAARVARYYSLLDEPGRRWDKFLRDEIKAQLLTVAIPDPKECCSDPEADTMEQEDDNRPGGTKLERKFIGARESFGQLLQRWCHLCRLADVDTKSWAQNWGLGDRCEPTSEQHDVPGSAPHSLSDLDQRLREFVHASVPRVFGLSSTYVRIPAILSLIRAHTGALIGLILAGGFALFLEAVNSLYRNDPWWSVFLALLVIAVPLLMWWSAVGRRKWRGHTPLYDLGGRSFRSFRPHALQPVAWRKRLRTVADTRKVMLGRLLALAAMIFFWTVIGAILLAVDIDDARLTVFAVSVILAGLIIVGSTLDFIDYHSQPPVRRSLLIVFIAYLIVTAWFNSEYLGIGVVVAAFVLLFLWLRAVRFHKEMQGTYGVIFALVMVVMGSTMWRRYQDTWRPDPVNVMALGPTATIGSASWPAGDALSSPPPVVVIAASGGGSRAAIYSAMAIEALQRDAPHVLENLQAIGSVSGGSLAAAAYVAARVHQYDPDPAMTCDDSLVGQMSANFVNPVLLGVLKDVEMGRGRAIQTSWEGCPVGLGDLRMSDLAHLWRARMIAGDTLPPFPVPLMHSASLQRNAVVVSPFAKEAYGVEDIDTEARGPNNKYSQFAGIDSSSPPRWVFYRSGVYGLDELLPGFDAKLSQAVRASANFPFGFPLVEIRSSQQLFLSPWSVDRSAGGPKTVRLTDGGALSNSGLWSLYQLLENWSSSRPTRPPRGVLLILVDASAMPNPKRANRTMGLVNAILDKNPKGEFLHRALLNSLAATFGQCFDAVELAIPPIRKWNVYTTWALDRGAIAKLRSAFEWEWARDSGSISAKFQQLQRCDPDKPSRWTITSRVPLS